MPMTPTHTKIRIMALAILLMLWPANGEAQEVHGRRELGYGVLEYTISGIRHLKYERDSTYTYKDFRRTYSINSASFPFYYEKWDDFKNSQDKIVVDATFTPIGAAGRGSRLVLCSHYGLTSHTEGDKNNHLHYDFQINQDDRFELYSGRENIINLTLIVNTFDSKGAHNGGHMEFINISYKPLEAEEEEDVGAHYEEDNDAWGFEGVWPFTIPASVLVGLLGYGLTKGKRKEDDDEDPKHPDPRQMLIYKEFGDTLIAGENSKLVYAMIVRKTKSGNEVPDPIMTKMITISAGDEYMLVKDDGMQGDWRAAWIQAPDIDKIPEEGIINFFMGNEGGSYTNRIHFQIEAGKVLFGQDNLTLPAHYKEEVRLPFVVVGYDGSKDVTASILEAGSEKPTDFYRVRVEWNEKKQLHEAIINDLKLDEKTDNGTPGNFISFTLKVEAQHPGGRKIEGWISLVRYYMGLVLKVGDIQCFTEEYNPSKHKKLLVGVQRGGKKYVPAETVGRLLLYDYDETTHQIVIINPIPSAETFSIKAVDEAENNQVQGIGINCDVVDNKDPKGTECVFRCVLGVLDPPSRIDAIIHVETEVEGKKYAYDKQVLLCSQPWRTFQTDAEWSKAVKEDEEIKRKLNKLIEKIERDGLAGRLLPIVKYIDNMLHGYDFNYGFDRDQLRFVGAMYNHMLTARQEYTFDQYPTPITLGDEMLMFAQSVIDTSIKPVVNATNKFNEKLGVPILIARIGIGFWTYGASEAYFKAYDALCIGVMAFNLAEIYVNEGKDGLTKNLIVMAKDTAKFQILMTGVQIGLHLGFSGLRAKYNPRTPSISTPVTPGDIKPKTQPTPSKKQFSSGKKGRITKQAISESNKRQAKAAKDVRSPEAELKAKGMKPERDLTDAIEYTKAKANRNIEDLHAVIEMCEQNPTPENKALMRKIIIEVQADKTAMHKLKNLGPEYQHVREVFNKEWFGEKGINQKVNKKVIAELAAENGLSPDEIKIENISSKKLEKLMSGDTSTMDLDTTYYYINKQGEKVYFNQKTTEQMYNRHLHKEALGYEANSQAAADKFAHKVDRTVIEDVAQHPESFGKEDVGRMMDSTRHVESLENPNKVSDAIIYKSEERFSRAEELFRKSDTITDHWEKMEVQRQAINELLEGGYMTAKDADNFVIPMDQARADVNGGLLVSNKLQRAIEHCRLVDTKDPINVMQLELRIKSEGYNSFSELAKDLGETMRRVGTPKLETPSSPAPITVNLNA